MVRQLMQLLHISSTTDATVGHYPLCLEAWRSVASGEAMGNESQAGKEDPESQEEGHIDDAKCHIAQW